MATAPAKKVRTKNVAPVEVVEPTVEAIKGFDTDLKCRGYQYAVGQTFEHSGTVRACSSGFHSVECPFDVFNYYPAATSRYAVVRASGEIARHEDDSKIASAKIYIEAEIKLPELIKRGVAWLIAHAKTSLATGYRGHAAATGDSGHAAATGDSGHAAATGDSGHAAATGDSGHAAATGDSGHAAATGYRGHAAATGYRGHAAATGDRGHAAATGDSGHAAATGYSAIAASLGIGGTATANEGGAITLAYFEWDSGKARYALRHVRSSMVGQNGVEPGKTYRLNAAGEFEPAA